MYWAHFHLATNKTVLETGMCDEKKMCFSNLFTALSEFYFFNSLLLVDAFIVRLLAI